MNKKYSVGLLVATVVLGSASLVSARVAGPQAMGGRGGRPAFHQPQKAAAHLEATAKLLGLTLDQLIAELKTGKTIKEVAAAHGVTEAQLEAANQAEHKAQAKLRLDALVKAGTITQAQADAQIQWEANFEQWMKDHPSPLKDLNLGMGMRGPGGHRPMSMGGFGR